MTKVRPLSKRHNVITGFGISYENEYLTVYRLHSYWVMTVITVITVITLITYIDPQLFWNGNRTETETTATKGIGGIGPPAAPAQHSALTKFLTQSVEECFFYRRY
jgi:hypothetical protein